MTLTSPAPDPAPVTASPARFCPVAALTPDQEDLAHEVLEFCRAHAGDPDPALFVVLGGPGTGKSVVLAEIFDRLQAEARDRATPGPLTGTDNHLLVNHAEMLRMYRALAERSPHVRKKDVERPTPFVNRMARAGGHADVTLVDEAHLLLTRSDPYNRFRQDNQLEEILRHSRVTVIVFDEGQVLKLRSHWDREAIAGFVDRFGARTYRLTTQLRMHADPEVLRWVDAFAARRVLPLPHPRTFDLRAFADPAELYRELRARNDEVGGARMISTYDYPYTLDGRDHFVEEGDFRLRWDRFDPRSPVAWADRPDSIDEVGSVYTVQGFDLSWAGVILGPSIGYDPARDRVVVHPEAYEDGAAFAGRPDLPVADRERIVLNSAHVLLTRGVRGLYVYAHDPALRRRLIG